MRLNEWLDHKWRHYQYQKKRESSRFKTNEIILPIDELMKELDDMEEYIEKVIEKIEVYK